ncbi:uncharacterized protein IWZ02DRAFT_215389 [Phyllosticta citriasiana]|uniref:uncharacterized protein n=1 Tax=Phyllosticta citriasiana TaxID=595635 RepID=UPI0030FDF6EE
MSGHLWKYYFEDDLENFRHLLEGNFRAAPPPRRSAGQSILATSLESPSSLGTSPTMMTRQKADLATRSRGFITLTRADINSKDANGLTILHHAATSTGESSFDFATALLEHPQIDLYSQDFENGWTSLHRAFYFGNISIARAIIDRDVKDALGHGTGGVVAHAGGLVKIKDREGNGPLDLFATTIKDRTLRPQLHEWVGSGDEGDHEETWQYEESGDDDRPSRRKIAPLVDIAGDELFMFGSNRNVTLGFGDEDDRQYPERPVLRRPDHLLKRFYREHLERKYMEDPERRLPTSHDLMISDLPAFIRSTSLVVQDVQLSKLHTAVITSDPEANLYICGHGPGGRLGTGSETTQFQFVCIEGGGLAHKRVLAVALGQNHTLAVSDEGEIFSWGNNAYGQLGYSLPKTAVKDEDPIQTLPRQIFGPLKKEAVTGVAASRLHSVAHTSSALYTFGKNEGQLGIVDSDARSLEFQVTPRRVAASLFTSPIRTVSAIDRATICLLENHEVWVFANYGYAKLAFPLDGFSNHFLKSSFLTTRYDSKPNQICKITSGGDSICAMSTAGEIYTVTVNKRSETAQDRDTSTTNPSKIRGALSQPYRIWSLKKGHMAARDVDIDQDGSIILTTDAGTVWRRVKRTKIKDATASGTGDYKPKDYKFQRVPGLTRVVAVRASAFGAYAAVRKDCDVTRKQIPVDEQALWDDIQPLLPFNDWFEEIDMHSNSATPSSPENPSGFHHLVRRVLDSDDLEQDLKDVTGMVEASEYDMVVASTLADVQIPAHQFIIASRSKVLRQALSALRRFGPHTLSDPQFGDLVSFNTEESGRVVMTLHSVDSLTLFNLVLYVYTDKVVDFWHYTRQSPSMAHRYRQVRTELMRLAAKLELKQLEPAVRQMIKPRRSLAQDMQHAVQDAAFFEDADVTVQLADGEIPVHSALMVQRCPFFEGLFKGRAAGRWLEGRRTEPDQAIKVDLEHIEKQVFELVLQYLYADAGDEIFDDFVSDNLGEALALNEYLDHIMDVLSVANELMLDRLSQVCQQVIGRHVNVRNVCQLLNAISPCAVSEFKDAALEYACLSLEAVLQTGVLDELDDDLLLELDEVVRENQLAYMPFARSGRAEMLLLEKYPGLAEQIDLRRRAKIDAFLLQNKHAEDVGRGPLSFRPGSLDELSSSPLQQKSRRRSGKDMKILPESPSFGPSTEGTTAADLMFDMDDEVDLAGELSGSLSTKPPPSQTLVLARELVSPSGKHQEATPATLPSVRSTGSWLSDDGFPPVGTSSSRAPDKPWGTAPLLTSKLDLKAIMSAESSNKPSNISLALSAQEKKDDRGAGASFAKMSQKERKKQQQQQQVTAAHLATALEETKSTSPWQTKLPATKTVSQNVTTESPTQPAASQQKTGQPNTPQLTMRQTIAKNGPAAKAKTSPAQVQSPTPSTPHRPQPSSHVSNDNTKLTSAPSSNGKGFAINQSSLGSQPPQSIRHIQQVQQSETSLQLSMQEILSQQAAEKAMIKDAAAKRSLQEIQQEQEFQEWWDKESRRVMEIEAARRKTEEKDQGKKKGSKGRNTGVRGDSGGGDIGAAKGQGKDAVGASSSAAGAGRSAKKNGRGDSNAESRRQQPKEKNKTQPDAENEFRGGDTSKATKSGSVTNVAAKASVQPASKTAATPLPSVPKGPRRGGGRNRGGGAARGLQDRDVGVDRRKPQPQQQQQQQ